MNKQSILFEIRATLETVAYWTHGFLGVFMIPVSIDKNYLLYFLFFPPAWMLALVAAISGFSSIPTAILSLLLIGIFIEAPHGPMINAYVLAWFFIVGCRIHHAYMVRRKRVN